MNVERARTSDGRNQSGVEPQSFPGRHKAAAHPGRMAARLEAIAAARAESDSVDAQALIEMRLVPLVRVVGSSLAFLMTCVYFMFEYVRPQSIYDALSTLPFAQAALIAAALLAAVEAGRDQRPIYGSQFPLLIAFVIVAMISMVLSKYPAAGIDHLKLIISWLFAIYAISRTVTTQSRFVAFYVLFLLFSLKMSQHGFRVWASHGFSFIASGVQGAPGWFRNSGEVGIQMCIFLPMTIYFAIAGWKSWSNAKRLFAGVVVVTIIGTIIGSSSRGAVLGAMVVLGWMTMRGRKNFLLLAILGAAVVALGYLVMPDQFLERFEGIGSDGNSQSRLRYWAYGWKVAKENPLFGIGLGNWIPIYSEHLQTIGSQLRVQVQHNIFVQALSELGFVGLGVVLAIIASTFRLNARTRKVIPQRDHALHVFSLGLDAGMIGFVVGGQFVTVLLYPYLWIALALTISLHNVAVRTANAPVRSEPEPLASDGAAKPDAA